MNARFSTLPCKKSRLNAGGAAKLARRNLRADPRSNVFARQSEHRAHVPVASGQSQKFLPLAEKRQPTEEETEVRSVIQQIALEHRRRYGYRRITAELG